MSSEIPQIWSSQKDAIGKRIIAWKNSYKEAEYSLHSPQFEEFEKIQE